MSETWIAAFILGLAVLLCFRIAWEEWKWPSRPRRALDQVKGEGGGDGR